MCIVRDCLCVLVAICGKLYNWCYSFTEGVTQTCGAFKTMIAVIAADCCQLVSWLYYISPPNNAMHAYHYSQVNISVFGPLLPNL